MSDEGKLIMFFREMALGFLVFATSGFVLGRVLATKMDINGEGLSGAYICYGVSFVSGLIGILVAIV
ncbi:hypothetical protein [Rhodovibrio salinarum]|uniref:Uncharacterized protein n=1 Tax=Rhodovibrio salinarum TaxID=1087 RepID=A0A934QGD9_9PROT|nr:hypothetical protein [Rhodovibrio salinarum]MBK1696152.1 hypothetical protein [Rhodovibrio salinarum]